MQTHVSVKAPVFWLVCHIVVILRRRCFSAAVNQRAAVQSLCPDLFTRLRTVWGLRWQFLWIFFLKDIFHSVHDRVTCLNGRTTLSVITEHLHKNKPQRLVSVIHSSLLRSGTLSTRRHVPTSCAKLKDITVWMQCFFFFSHLLSCHLVWLCHVPVSYTSHSLHVRTCISLYVVHKKI